MYTEEQKQEPCANCKEIVQPCACIRNKCVRCSGPVGNITFCVCEDCWYLDKPTPSLHERAKRYAQENGYIGKTFNAYLAGASEAPGMRWVRAKTNPPSDKITDTYHTNIRIKDSDEPVFPSATTYSGEWEIDDMYEVVEYLPHESHTGSEGAATLPDYATALRYAQEQGIGGPMLTLSESSFKRVFVFIKTGTIK